MTDMALKAFTSLASDPEMVKKAQYRKWAQDMKDHRTNPEDVLEALK